MKHLFFDMDGTLTESRTEISREMRAEVLTLVSEWVDVIVVSGAQKSQIFKQLGNLVEEIAILSQNGNHAESSIGNLLWENKLDWMQQKEVFEWIWKVDLLNKYPRMHPEALVENRGCQISYSLIGHDAPREQKISFDPDGSKRTALLKKQPFESDSVEVKIGGTTCLDFFQKGKHKGANIARFISDNGWDFKDCKYVGDALFPGGNDESVIGVIDTIPVKNPADCLRLIKDL